jgi:hypothetical protein
VEWREAGGVGRALTRMSSAKWQADNIVPLPQSRRGMNCLDEENLAVTLAEDDGGFGFVAEFGVGFVDRDVGGVAGGETAVGVEIDLVG